MHPVPATWLVVASLLVASPAAAQRSKSSAKTAPAPASALGGSKEEAPSPPPVDPGKEADRSLLMGLLYAFQPAPREIRVLAVEDLALLGDPRALDPLAHLILDPDPAVALAAVKAVTRIQHPRADEILGNVIRHPKLAVELKMAAIRGLPYQDSPAARELLTEISTGGRWSSKLIETARATLREMVPRALQASGAGAN